MTSKAKSRIQTTFWPVDTEAPATVEEILVTPVDISHELSVFDAPRLLNVPGSKPSVGLVVGDNVYIATADATGQPKLVVESLQWFQTAYGKA